MAPATTASCLSEDPESLPRYYFAYGSNLSPTQMIARCPGSVPLGLAHLPHAWSWLINGRGYANVIHPSYPDSTSLLDGVGIMGFPDGMAAEAKPQGEANRGDDDTGHGVYGVLYTLSTEDEAELDIYEGVPYAYEKVMLPVQLIDPSLHSHASQPSQYKGVEQAKQENSKVVAPTVLALVYLDFDRVVPDAPRTEYIARMNRAIHEAQLSFGLPVDYVRHVMRKFIPEGDWEGAGIAPED
ncbi:hypothetical protein SODALDRAFT_328295 [Sodiomyces alkalinus F11]|uniref:gamma-glutamylcyclotransferase n=1 Tax=Sodiomyces alkalinus (strain CBS 110278 / VKM F-3762 / F11) TaxID=1314773 RepID=A0A3N2PN04_SODAK|nr:hypothetical protein SODALDRAFT_328295 [Sodiomyces alkalinus F11]ROT35908.1 hypothetical protein SODALDRAFT_328295 [Sodiomyces alkalinus F11]